VFVDVVAETLLKLLGFGIFCVVGVVVVRNESAASDARCFLPGVRVKNDEDDAFFAGEFEKVGACIGCVCAVAKEAL
jgi:hypothetical protein